MRPKDNECIYIAKTLSHFSALIDELLVALRIKIKIIIAPRVVSPRFVFNSVKKYKVSMVGVNLTLLNMYVYEVGRNKYMLSSLKKQYILTDLY